MLSRTTLQTHDGSQTYKRTLITCADKVDQGCGSGYRWGRVSVRPSVRSSVYMSVCVAACKVRENWRQRHQIWYAWLPRCEWDFVSKTSKVTVAVLENGWVRIALSECLSRWTSVKCSWSDCGRSMRSRQNQRSPPRAAAPHPSISVSITPASRRRRNRTGPRRQPARCTTSRRDALASFSRGCSALTGWPLTAAAMRRQTAAVGATFIRQ